MKLKRSLFPLQMLNTHKNLLIVVHRHSIFRLKIRRNYITHTTQSATVKNETCAQKWTWTFHARNSCNVGTSSGGKGGMVQVRERQLRHVVDERLNPIFFSFIVSGTLLYIVFFFSVQATCFICTFFIYYFIFYGRFS